MKDKFYAVYRIDYRSDGNPYIRVSEFTYKNEQDAKNELAYWEDILHRYPDSTRVIVK
jgi:hypothetical protein